MTDPKEFERSEAEWRSKLNPEEYHVLREKGTERAFTGTYWNHKEAGKYLCKGCGNELFNATAKYDSGSGWPSYWEPVHTDAINAHADHSHGMVRTEVTCSRCGSHLGHVFGDGPRPSGQRYCINSASLDFKPTE